MTGQRHTQLFSCCIFFLLIFSLVVLASTSPIKITGTVTSAEDGQTLIGVNILEKRDGQRHRHRSRRNLRPHSRIRCRAGFLYIGFENQEIAVQGRLKLTYPSAKAQAAEPSCGDGLQA
ncbi:MAG: hypothetical protein IPM82_21360 [Saprospiraceae bacterium]|nr:hypothetical protein [Saprospiraceae bacterium]